ncbi:uncharacterized protein METZ01_LOCUS13736 [marine metagenome]|uniref:Uncharacterized protein n=1 Tax=marine metagenome TaxID=408172 RepID=A0A381P1V9_9ZZZZ
MIDWTDPGRKMTSTLLTTECRLKLDK